MTELHYLLIIHNKLIYLFIYLFINMQLIYIYLKFCQLMKEADSLQITKPVDGIRLTCLYLILVI